MAAKFTGSINIAGNVIIGLPVVTVIPDMVWGDLPPEGLNSGFPLDGDGLSLTMLGDTWIVGREDGKGSRTVNGGHDWVRIDDGFGNPSEHVESLHLSPSGVGFAGLHHLYVGQTNDFGATWTAAERGLNSGITGGNGVMFLTGDNNGNWFAAFIDGYCSASFDDGASQWTPLPRGLGLASEENITAGDTDRNGTWLMALEGGEVSRSVDNMSSWTPVTSATTNPLFQPTDMATDGTVWLLCGFDDDNDDRFVYKSTDAGDNWSLLSGVFGRTIATDRAGQWVIGDLFSDGPLLESTDNADTFHLVPGGLQTGDGNVLNKIRTNETGDWVAVIRRGWQSVSPPLVP